MPHGSLEWDIDQLQHAMHLYVDDVHAYFTDDRRISFMLERRLMREVLGGRLAISEGDDHDLVDAQGKNWEVRSVSGGGNLLLSKLHGRIGTLFMCDGFLRKLGMIHGYVVSDITQFPKVPYWLVEAALVRQWWDNGKLASTTKIPRWRALELLQTVA